MSKRQSNVHQRTWSPKQPYSMHHNQLHSPSSSSIHSSRQAATTRDHRNKLQQCNILSHPSTNLFGQDTCFQDDLKLTNLFTRQSNITCRSSLSDSISAVKDVNGKIQETVFEEGLLPTLISTRVGRPTSSAGGVGRHMKGEEERRERQVLQALENVGFVEEDVLFGHLQQQNGSNADLFQERRLQHQSEDGSSRSEKGPISLKRKHARTTTTDFKGSNTSSDDEYDDSFVTMTTNEGSLHFSELLSDVEERMEQRQAKTQKWSPVSGRGSDIFYPSPKPTSAEMYSSLPYYRGYQADKSLLSSSIGYTDALKRQNVQTLTRTSHHHHQRINFLTEEESSVTHGQPMPATNYANKENVGSYSSRMPSVEDLLTGGDVLSIRLTSTTRSPGTPVAVVEEDVLGTPIPRHQKFSSLQQTTHTYSDDEDGPVSERLKMLDNFHTIPTSPRSANSEPQVPYSASMKAKYTEDSRLGDTMKHSDALKEHQTISAFQHDLAIEIPEKSLYSEYQEQLIKDSQTKSEKVPKKHGDSKSMSVNFLASSVSLDTPSNQSSMEIFHAPSEYPNQQSSSVPQQSAISSSKNGYHNTVDGYSSDEDDQDYNALHDHNQIWESIRYVAEELNNDKMHVSYHPDNETKVTNLSAKSKSTKAYQNSSISVPSRTRNSPHDQDKVQYHMQPSTTQMISSVDHQPNLSNMSSIQHYANRHSDASSINDRHRPSSGHTITAETRSKVRRSKARERLSKDKSVGVKHGTSMDNTGLSNEYRAQRLKVMQEHSSGVTAKLKTSPRRTGNHGNRSAAGSISDGVYPSSRAVLQSPYDQAGYVSHIKGKPNTTHQNNAAALTQIRSSFQEDTSSPRSMDNHSNISAAGSISDNAYPSSRAVLQSSYNQAGYASHIKGKPNTTQRNNAAVPTQISSSFQEDTQSTADNGSTLNTSVYPSSRSVLQSSYNQAGRASHIKGKTKTTHQNNAAVPTQIRSTFQVDTSSFQEDTHLTADYGRTLDHSRSINSSGTFHLEDLDSSSHPEVISKIVLPRGSKHHQLHRTGAKRQNQSRRRTAQQSVSPRRSKQDLNISSGSSLSSLSPNGKSPRRTTSILWAFKLLDLLHTAPAEKQEQLVTKAYWFRRWQVNVRIMLAAKREDKDNWNRAVALHNLHLLQKMFTAWHGIIKGNQEAAYQMYYHHTLERGLRGFQWAVSHTKMIQESMEDRRQRRVLASHFNRWKNLSEYKRQRMQLLDTIARKYTLSRSFALWKKQHAMEQRSNIAVLHYKLQLLTSTFSQWQRITARSRVKSSQEEMAIVHYEVRITKKYWETMKTRYVQEQQAQRHYRHRMLQKLFHALQQGCMIAKRQHLHENCRAKETRRSALIRSHLVMWRERLQERNVIKRLNYVKLRYAWELWYLRYQRQKLHQKIVASQQRREAKRKVLHTWKTYVRELKARRRQAEAILGRVLLGVAMQRWRMVAMTQIQLREKLQNHTNCHQLQLQHHIFQHWVNQWRLVQSTRLRQRLWSERCVKKAVMKWKLCVHVRRLQVMSERHRTIKQQRIVQGTFRTWQVAHHKAKHAHERVRSARCILQHNQLHRILLVWRLVTMEMKSIAPMIQRRNHKVMASIFDGWRNVVRRKQLCSHHQAQLKRRKMKKIFINWSEKSKQTQRYQTINDVLFHKKLTRHLLAWQQVASRRSTIRTFQGQCHRRLVQRAFSVWQDKYEAKQLEQEICRASEIRSHLLVKIYFSLWRVKYSHQKKLRAERQESLQEGSIRRQLQASFKMWKQQTKIAQFTRKIQHLREQHALHVVLQEWHRITKASLQQAVFSFSLSLLETASHSFISSTVADDELKTINLESSSSDEHIPEQPPPVSSSSSSDEPVSDPSPDAVSSPIGSTSNPAYSSIPDSGYLGNIRTSSSPSLSSGVYDHAIPMQYLSHSGSKMLFHGQVYSSTPRRRRSFEIGEDDALMDGTPVHDRLGNTQSHNDFDVVEGDNESGQDHALDIITDDWWDLSGHHVHPWSSVPHGQHMSQHSTASKHDLVMSAIQRWQLWPASAVFYQWLAYTRKQKVLRALQHQGQYQIAHVQMMHAWKEWKQRLETNKMAQKHKNSRQKALIFRHWRLWSKKQGQQTRMKSDAKTHANEKITRKAFVTWKRKVKQCLDEQRMKQDQMKQLEQLKLKRETQCQTYRARIEKKTMSECLQMWRYRTERLRTAQVHYNRIVVSRCLSVWSAWTDERLTWKKKCKMVQSKRQKYLAFNHWKTHLRKVQAADDFYKRSVKHHIKRTLQEWHMWACKCKQQQYREAEMVVMKQRERRVMCEYLQQWKKERDSMKIAKDMADKNGLRRYFLQWKHFITKRQHLQRSQTTLQHTASNHQLNSAFVYWKHAYQCSQRSKTHIAKRNKSTLQAAFEGWRQWGIQCKADRHRQLVMLTKVFHTWRERLQLQKEKKQRLVSIIHHWKAKAQRNKEKDEALCVVEQDWNKRCLQKVWKTWRDSLVKANKADEHYRMYVLRRLLSSWRQSISKKQSLQVVQVNIQTKTKREHLNQAFHIWLAKYRRVEDLDHCLTQYVKEKEEMELRQSFMVWKVRLTNKDNLKSACEQERRMVTKTYFNTWKDAYHRKCAAEHSDKVTAMKAFKKWKEFVRIRREERRCEQDMEVLARAHYQQRICKQLIQLWHHEVLVERQLVVRRERLARKYSTQWLHSVAMQKTATHMCTYWKYRRVWREWRRQVMQNKAVRKVENYNDMQLSKQVLAAWMKAAPGSKSFNY